MARRKNTKFIDPRYFMDEKMERLDESLPGFVPTKPDYSHVESRGYLSAGEGMKPRPKTYSINNNVIAAVDEQGRIEVYVGASPRGVIEQLEQQGYTKHNFPVVGPAR